jgi:hypothetical protein
MMKAFTPMVSAPEVVYLLRTETEATNGQPELEVKSDPCWINGIGVR